MAEIALARVLLIGAGGNSGSRRANPPPTNTRAAATPGAPVSPPATPNVQNVPWAVSARSERRASAGTPVVDGGPSRGNRRGSAMASSVSPMESEVAKPPLGSVG